MIACRECSSPFEITDADRRVFEKFHAPEPALCPDCRMRRRTAFRNEMNFHKAKCHLTGKSVLTNFPPDSGYRVISSGAWHGDEWDSMEYGRDFDFSRPFFEQMDNLIRDVPHFNLMTDGKSENCDYCNYTAGGKDCYICARVADSEKVCYSYIPIHSYNCFDCYYIRKCQECYQLLDSSDCHVCRFSQRLKTCQRVYFSMDCIGCEDCVGCVGLRHKKYHFFNRPLKKEEYIKALEKLDLGSYAFIKKFNERFYEQEVVKHPLRCTIIENSEDTVGNYVFDSRKVYMGFDVNDSEDVRFGWGILNCKDNFDAYATYRAEQVYDAVSVLDSQQIKHSYAVYNGCYNLEYCFECLGNVKDCFGCVGLKRKQYCILNKQYAKGDYEALISKIKDHMTQSGEYGQFFPMPLAPFAYNETVSYEYLPLERKEAEGRGLFWLEEQRNPKEKTYEIPDHIKDVKDDILDAVLTCEKTGRPYNVISQELRFCRQYGIPIPRLCPYARHMERIRQRAPRKLWDRECRKCGAPVKTVYAPDRPEKVVCERCYLAGIY